MLSPLHASVRNGGRSGSATPSPPTAAKMMFETAAAAHDAEEGDGDSDFDYERELRRSARQAKDDLEAGWANVSRHRRKVAEGADRVERLELKLRRMRERRDRKNAVRRGRSGGNNLNGSFPSLSLKGIKESFLERTLKTTRHNNIDSDQKYKCKNCKCRGRDMKPTGDELHLISGKARQPHQKNCLCRTNFREGLSEYMARLGFSATPKAGKTVRRENTRVSDLTNQLQALQNRRKDTTSELVLKNHQRKMAIAELESVVSMQQDTIRDLQKGCIELRLSRGRDVSKKMKEKKRVSLQFLRLIEAIQRKECMLRSVEVLGKTIIIPN